MNIQLINTKVVSLSIESHEPRAEDELSPIKDFSFKAGFYEEVQRSYVILFNIALVTECNKLINVKYEAIFETDDDIDEQFENSPFISVNSPAIGYPYLRAYISTLLTLSGLDSIVLPTVNFQAIHDENWKHQD
jgi:preprotein translocase subunit SecB